MKKFFGIMSAVFFLTVTAFTAALSADSPRQPKIEIEPTNYDVGNIGDDVKAKAVFTIKNSGNAELVIIDAKPTCGCTVANLTSKQIAPGKTATLEAVYDAHNGNGLVKKFVNIKSNDPKAETVTVTITANVTPKPAPDAALSAYNVLGLLMSKGGKDVRSIKIISNGQEPLVVNEISATPGISGEVAGTSIPAGQNQKTNIVLQPGETKDLEVAISPKAQIGYFQEVLTIRSNSRRHPALTFIAQGTVQ